MIITHYINSEGFSYKVHAGQPRKKRAFIKASKDAVRIRLSGQGYFDLGYFDLSFYKVEGRWVSKLFQGPRGWLRYAILAEKSLMRVVVEFVSPEEAEDQIAEESARVLSCAQKAILWCDPLDWRRVIYTNNDYRIIVQNGNILGAVVGDLSASPYDISEGVWDLAISKAIEERVSGEFHLLKVSGCMDSIFLKNVDDSQYIQTEINKVRKPHGIFGLNIMVKPAPMD